MMTHRHLGADKVVRGETLQARDDINITPLVDVLLVLLVIFMVALPLTQKALDTKLPTTSAPHGQPASDIVLEYTNVGQISINREPISLPQLESRLRTIYADRLDKTMYVIGAGTLRYKQIVEVIDAAKGAGVEKVGIVTEKMRQQPS
jgi:biopolymer transport protein TolR